jgi:hypothetical protein
MEKAHLDPFIDSLDQLLDMISIGSEICRAYTRMRMYVQRCSGRGRTFSRFKGLYLDLDVVHKQQKVRFRHHVQPPLNVAAVNDGPAKTDRRILHRRI